MFVASRINTAQRTERARASGQFVDHRFGARKAVLPDSAWPCSADSSDQGGHAHRWGRRSSRCDKMTADHPNNSDETILFADDNGQLQKSVAALLRKFGYRVILASDGKDALQKAREFEGVIHLLLSDVEMPGMTGIELAIQLNQERPDTKVLLISGLAAGMLVLNNGWSFLSKPFVSDMLRNRIRDFLSEQPPTKEHLPGT